MRLGGCHFLCFRGVISLDHVYGNISERKIMKFRYEERRLIWALLRLGMGSWRGGRADLVSNVDGKGILSRGIVS